jgi:hypothetical protein
MPFAFPEGLAPEVYPLAWLVGRWRGEGVVEYPGIESTAFVNDVVFDHDGGPYLRYETTIRIVDEDGGRVWSTETGYWRVSSERPEGVGDDRHALEVLLSDASGRLSLFLGVVGNGRIDLATDFVARTSTASEVTAAKRLYGLVEGRLMWAEDLAAFGHPLHSYASAQLDRA